MSSITYLHDLSIVHGDLKGVSPTLLTYFLPLTSVTGEHTHRQHRDRPRRGLRPHDPDRFKHKFPIRNRRFFWGDILLDEPGAPGTIALWLRWPPNSRVGLLRARDGNLRGERVAALTMVLFNPHQVLTGLRPFHRLHGFTPVPAILRGERPGKPLDAESFGFSQQLWGLVQLCWDELTSTRPTAQQLLDYLYPASLIPWVPPSTYPAIDIDPEDITESESSGSSGMHTSSLGLVFQMEVSSFPSYLLLFACPEVYFVMSCFTLLYTLATIKGYTAV